MAGADLASGTGQRCRRCEGIRGAQHLPTQEAQHDRRRLQRARLGIVRV